MDRPDYCHLARLFHCRRRPSLFSRKNHETVEQPWAQKALLDQGEGSNSSSFCMVEELGGENLDAPNAKIRYQKENDATSTAGPFSSRPRNGIYGQQPAIENKSILLGRTTLERPKSFHGPPHTEPQNSNGPSKSFWRPLTGVTSNQAPGPSPAPRGWLRRCMSTTLGRRHRAQNTTKPPCDGGPLRNRAEMLPIPGIGIEPPQVPDSTTSGAAARAAAAAQNEMLESTRNMRLSEPIVTKDCESGIGIEVRYRGGESTENTTPVVRRDPSAALPEELIAQILSYLDATSLTNVELVSHRWQRSASSRHSWKHIFHQEYKCTRQPHPIPSAVAQIGGQGLGKSNGDQDWKSMWKARKALDQRWADGYAAAIYLEGHTDCVYCVQFDEHKIITGSRDRTVRVWDAHTYECIKVLGVPSRNEPRIAPLPINVTGHGHRPCNKIFSPSSVFEHNSGPVSEYHHGSILCLQYDEEIIVTGSSDSTLIVWDIRLGYQPVRRLCHHTAGVLDVCFDTKHIVSCSKDMTVCLWDRRTGEFLRSLNGHRGPVNAVQLRGNLVVSASGDGVAKLWNLTSGLCIKEFPSKDRGMACIEFSPDSRTILAGGNDQVIYQFDTNTGELVRELMGHKNLVRSLHLDSANGRIISGSYDTSVRAYDLRTGDTIVDFTGWTTSWILSAKADYRRIIATSQDSRAVIMDFGYQLPGIELLEG